MQEKRTLKIEEIHKLVPAFDGSYGWLSIDELDVIAGNNSKNYAQLGMTFIDEVTFENGSIFVLIKKNGDQSAL